ncbi:MAG: sulfur oxidation c-type cytochrome SoxX [Pseudomonadota bacterium]
MAVTSIAGADVIKPGDVAIKDGAIATSLTNAKGNPDAGKEAFIGRRLGNCLACHVNSDTSKEQFHGEVGPALDGVASRYSEAELRAIIVNSKAVFGEGTIMPAFYKASGYYRAADKFEGKSILSAEQVEDVVAYLMTLTDKP